MQPRPRLSPSPRPRLNPSPRRRLRPSPRRHNLWTGRPPPTPSGAPTPPHWLPPATRGDSTRSGRAGTTPRPPVGRLARASFPFPLGVDLFSYFSQIKVIFVRGFCFGTQIWGTASGRWVSEMHRQRACPCMDPNTGYLSHPPSPLRPRSQYHEETNGSEKNLERMLCWVFKAVVRVHAGCEASFFGGPDAPHRRCQAERRHCGAGSH